MNREVNEHYTSLLNETQLALDSRKLLGSEPILLQGFATNGCSASSGIRQDQGDMDVERVAARAEDEGWFYKWWRGLHCLMGKEGYDAGMYLTRPSHEKSQCEGFGFKIGFRTAIQAPKGASMNGEEE